MDFTALITDFLAGIWGPVLLAAGLGMYVSAPYYRRVYRELERAPFALLTFGMVAMSVGIVHVQAHNVWGSLPEVIVSIIGWGLLLKGFLSLLVPKLADRMGDWWADTKLVPTAGVAAIVIGAYLSWFAYLA